MAQFRITIRHGKPHRYHVVDVEAADLRAAVVQAAEHVPAAESGGADLLEIRRLIDPDSRGV